jgi:DNA polymerase elongation subunit (family B)
MRREHNLDSYTLDNGASTFLRDKVIRVEGSTIFTKNTRGLTPGNYVKFDLVGNTMDPFREGAKFEVVSVQPKSFTIREELVFEGDVEWSFTKDDISPQDIFDKHEGGPEDRALVAKYCIQDCDLVLTLMAKLDTLINARGMADVCFVPLQYLFLRGQGIKIFSRVAYEASKRSQIIVTQESFEGDAGYEGAIVIEPRIGMYLDTPVAVLDFNSLYPSSMIGENLSPDTLICVKTYNNDGKLTRREGSEDYKGIPVNEVSYDIKKEEVVVGKCVCVYVRPTEDNELSTGLIPRSLEIMLSKRKEARKKMEDPLVDDSQKSVYNGLQLAYKVVANSIYGQMGSKTSPIRKI